jgi:iron(III) transport system substrate-binding protein
VLRPRKAAAAAITAAAFILMAGCAGNGNSTGSASQPTKAGGDLDSLISQAKQEGSLTFYGDANEASLQAWTKGFTDKYGIPVTVLRLPGSQLFQRFSQEESAGQAQADIFANADYASLEQAVKQQWLASYTPQNGDLLPVKSLGEPGYFYPVQDSYYQTVTYNTSKLTPDEIAAIKKDPIAAAGDPRFSGRVAVNMPQSSQQIAAFYYQLTDGKLKSKYGWKALQKIAANKPKFLSSADLVNAVVQGEYAIGVGVTDSLAAPIALKGAPIQFTYPGTTVGGSFGDGVVANAPHPKAARLFMEWATTPEAGKLYATLTQTKPLNSKVEDQRQITQQSWYQAPDDKSTWFSFVSDKTFLTAVSPDGGYYDQWNKTMGYSG